MAELAKRQNIVVKVGGLGMAMGWFDFYQRPTPPGSQELAEAFRPWVETCIELFGVEPLHVREQLPGRQDHVAATACCGTPSSGSAAKASAAEKTALFSGTASRVYKLLRGGHSCVVSSLHRSRLAPLCRPRRSPRRRR